MRKMLIRFLLNEREREAIARVRGWTRGAHYLDVMVRRNGTWERWEADILRALGDLAR